MNKRVPKLDFEASEWIAIHALSFLAGDAGRLGRFLALTGVGPADLAAGRNDPLVLACVLEYLLGDEPLLLEFAANTHHQPEEIEPAWDLLTLEAARRRR